MIHPLQNIGNIVGVPPEVVLGPPLGRDVATDVPTLILSTFMRMPPEVAPPGRDVAMDRCSGARSGPTPGVYLPAAIGIP
jgi:hypothetical protein